VRRANLRAGWCGSFICSLYRLPGRGCFEKGFGFMLCTETRGYRGMGHLVEERIYRGEPNHTTSSVPSILTGRRAASSPVNHYLYHLFERAFL